MNRFKQLGFFAIALTFFFGALAVTDTKAQVLNEILNRMQNHKDNLQSMKADVKMSKTDATLGISDTTEGNTYYLPGKGRDAYVRINWTKPLEETLLVMNGTYILYRPRLNQAIKGKVSDSSKNSKTNSALDFMNMSKRELRSNYTIKKLDNTKMGGDEVWHLRLTPKAKKSYKLAEIWVNKDGMPVQAKIVEENDDSTTVRLSNIKENLTIDSAVFNWRPPKGTNWAD
jgi:outer membrane lipoprotein-sorting protein